MRAHPFGRYPAGRARDRAHVARYATAALAAAVALILVAAVVLGLVEGF